MQKEISDEEDSGGQESSARIRKLKNELRQAQNNAKLEIHE